MVSVASASPLQQQVAEAVENEAGLPSAPLEAQVVEHRVGAASPAAAAAAAATAAAAAVTTCAQCLAIQETIGRAIAQNISGIRRRAVHATLPIHDIVQGLCDTEAWAAERYQPELEQACVRATRPGWFELFEHWSAPGLALTRTLTLTLTFHPN